jgi:hypothetical protein
VSDTSFIDRLQSHVGGLVRVADHPVAFLSLPWLNSKVGLLLSARPVAWDKDHKDAAADWAVVDIFVDGSVHNCAVKSSYLNLVGAEDGSI